MNMVVRCFGLLIVVCCCGLTACDEVHRSDTPVTREEAIKLADGNMPIPAFATNVRFVRSGRTQSWDYYLSYDAPAQDMGAFIEKELISYTASQQDLGSKRADDYRQKPITPKPLEPSLANGSPNWWRPLDIQHGYFQGSSELNSGPRFWVDTEKGHVFFFEHSN